jgi:hypothetical protein
MREASAAKRDRRWVRVRKRFKVTFSQNASFTIDVSGGGFCAQLLRVMPPGTLVEGTILDNGKALSYAGRVVWARAGDAHLSIPGRMGVEFTNIDAMLPKLEGDATTAATIVAR